MSLQQQIHEYGERMSAQGHEQVYYKAMDLENWLVQTRDSKGVYMPGLCNRYLILYRFPTSEDDVRAVFEVMKRCEPLRSRIETFIRSYFDESNESTDHLEALAALVDRFPNEQLYKDQLAAERVRLQAYPRLPAEEPLRKVTNTFLYAQYESAIAFLMELDQQTYPYETVEKRFSLWRKEVMTQRASLPPNKMAPYKRGYTSYSGGSTYLAGYNSKAF